MINRLFLNKKIYKILGFIVLLPFLSIIVNYMILTLMWLGRYFGTFLRLLYRLVS